MPVSFSHFQMTVFCWTRFNDFLNKNFSNISLNFVETGWMIIENLKIGDIILVSKDTGIYSTANFIFFFLFKSLQGTSPLQVVVWQY